MMHSDWCRNLCALAALGITGSLACGQGQRLSGRVKLDGSSTVAPVMMTAAELFAAEQPRVKVTVGVSGTGGGFKKFLEKQPDLRTDISNASRPITATEVKQAADLGVAFIELPIAYDGMAVVVHPSNTFCNELTVEELWRIWEPQSKINNWKDVRAGFPDRALKLFGPGSDSGTFDYFTEAIMGKARASRSDYTASENDNALVQGVAGEPGGLGYFGYSYYEANHDRLKLLGIADQGGQPVKPNVETIRNGQYRPLSRPLFLYVNRDAAERPEVRAFLEFFFANAKAIIEHPRVNYVALSDATYAAARQRLEKRITGTVYTDAGTHTKSLDELYRTTPRTP